MKRADAKYFDGKSSASWSVTATLYDSLNELHFQTDDGISHIWKIGDLQLEKFGPVLEVRNNKYQDALLKLEDEGFAQTFYSVMKRNKRVDIHTRLLHFSLSKVLGLAFVLLALVALFYWLVLPPLAEKSATLLPESFDDRLGNTFMHSFLDENEIDSTKTKQLEEFAFKLDLENKKPLQFAVVDSDIVNAFALPNGQIVVYTAILDSMKTPAELVGLLGHEATHVNQRHTIKSLCRELAGYMVVSLVLSDVNGIMSVIAGNARQLNTLSHSRKFEKEADEKGLQILMENHMDPNGMILLFEQLDRENTVSVPQILSSHPLTKERIVHMEKMISKSDYEINATSELDSLFEKLIQ